MRQTLRNSILSNTYGSKTNTDDKNLTYKKWMFEPFPMKMSLGTVGKTGDS